MTALEVTVLGNGDAAWATGALSRLLAQVSSRAGPLTAERGTSVRSDAR